MAHVKSTLFSSVLVRILAGVVAVSSVVGAVGFGLPNSGDGDQTPNVVTSEDVRRDQQAPDQISLANQASNDSTGTSGNRGKGQDKENPNNGKGSGAAKDPNEKDPNGKGNNGKGNGPSSTTTTLPTTTSAPGEPTPEPSTSTSSPTTSTPSVTTPPPPTTTTTRPSTTTTTKAPTTTTTKPTTTTTAPPPTTTTTAPATTTTTKAPTTTTAPPAPGLTESGPVIVRSSNVVLDGYHFTGSGSSDCVRIEGASNVTVKNSKFTNCHKGVYALNASNIVVTNNTFTADRSDRGRNAVQFDKVSRGRIANNSISVSIGGTKAEDHINLYKSNGTAANPIYVENNTIRGGGPSRSGSGIMLGDGGGSYQVARNNILVNPGQVGIGVAGGQYISVLSNKVYSPARSWSNVGIYIWNQYDPACSGHTVSYNEVDWRNSSGSRNGFWDGKNCGAISMSGNNFSASLSHLD